MAKPRTRTTGRYLPIKIAEGLNRFNRYSTEGMEEKFEQKAAKETKVNRRSGYPSWSSGKAFGASPIVLIVLAASPNAVAEPYRAAPNQRSPTAKRVPCDFR